MDGDGDGEIDTWRRDQLADEPLYCSAPSPTDPDDIICYGSDEDLDDASRIAKRLLYEEQGLRYLRGQPIRLVSATLRGPFDRASGWRNPWQSKTSANLPSKNTTSTHITKHPPAVEKPLLRLCPVSNNATPNTDTSMQCQLPSPESNRGAEADHDYLSFDQHGRIQAWAKDVTTVPLTKDEFWAPDKDTAHGCDPTQKRQAAEEWLRKKPTKRNRLNNIQGTTSASTPTPLPAPTFPVHDMPSSRTRSSQGCTNLSFELTTPSSSADQIPAKPTAPQPTSNCVNSDMQSDDGSSIANADTLSSATPSASDVSNMEPLFEPKIRTTCDQPTSSVGIRDPCEKQQQDSAEHNTKHNTTDDMEQSETKFERETESHADDIGDITMESFADASFQYHARPLKVEEGLEEMPSTQERHGSSEAMQATTSESRDHAAEDTRSTTTSEQCIIPVEVTAAVGGPAKPTDIESDASKEKDSETCQISTNPPDDMESQSMQGLDEFHGDVSPAPAEDARELTPVDHTPGMVIKDETPTKPHCPATVDDASDVRISHMASSLLKRQHDAIESVPLETPELQLKKMRIEEPAGSDDAANAMHVEDTIVCHGNDHIEDTVVCHGNDHVEDTIRCHENDETEIIVQGTVANDGVIGPLVEDAMDVDRPLEPPCEPPQATKPTDVEEGKTCERQPPHARSPNRTQDEMSEAEAESESESESKAKSESIVLPLSHQEWGILDGKEATVSNDVPTVPTEMPEGQGSMHGSPVVLLESGKDRCPQTPWALHDVLKGSRVEGEPVHKGTETPRQSSADQSPLRSRRDLQTPGIRASQQSPWVKEVTPPRAEPREQNFKMDIKFMIESVPSPQGEQESPCDKENIPMESSPRTYPIPSVDGNSEEITETPSQSFEKPELVAQSARLATPEPEISLKSFATFNTPSPVRRTSQPQSRKSTGRRSGILANCTPSNPWSSAKSSNRRVSFAPLPGQEDEMQDETVEPLARRAASPPPENTLDAEEDVNDAFRKHFDAVKKRGGKPPGPHFERRPSQKPTSSIGSTDVDVFHTSDTTVAADHDAAAAGRENVSEEPEPELTAEATEMDVDKADSEDMDPPQSPWRSQGTTQQVDDVAAVLGNLDQFLDAWDVDAALDQAAAAPSPEVDALQRISIWD